MSLDEMLFPKDEPELPVRAAEAAVSEPQRQEGYSREQGSETNAAGGGYGTNHAWEGNNPGWQENGGEWQEGSAKWQGKSTAWHSNGNEWQEGGAGWQGNGVNPGFQGNWGADERKRISKLMHAFPYPIFITMVYLALGFVIGLWHPGWLLFLTIPMYYMLADAIGKA